MTCKLGLDNTDEQGGRFEGEGIASLVKGIRSKFEKDGYTGVRTDEEELTHPRPVLWVTINTPGLDIGSMFEDDSHYSTIKCAGFGYDCPSIRFSNSCKGCSYLNKPEEQVEAVTEEVY